MTDLRLIGPADSLADALGVGHDLVAFVGAGGKTTLVHRVGDERRRAGDRVILTTTTKMGTDQERGLAVVGSDAGDLARALKRDGICLAVSEVLGTKLVGVDPGVVDGWWAQGLADLVAVEADGARRNLVKAPAEHEPVIPSNATVVVWVMSSRALGRPIAEVAHRPGQFATQVGTDVHQPVTPELVARLVVAPDGGHKGVPGGARFLVAVTRVPGEGVADAARLAELIHPIPMVATAAGDLVGGR